MFVDEKILILGLPNAETRCSMSVLSVEMALSKFPCNVLQSSLAVWCAGGEAPIVACR